MEVAIWQISIFLVIVFSSLIFGRRGLAWSAGIAAAWTVIMIFTSWLMTLQFMTIALGGIAGALAFDKTRGTDGKIDRQILRELTVTGQMFLGVAIFGGAFLLHKFHPEHFWSLDFGSLGIASAYGLAVLAAAVVGGVAFWCVGGLGWRDWSADTFRTGGVIAAVGLGVALVVGQSALQKYVASSEEPKGNPVVVNASTSSAPTRASPSGERSNGRDDRYNQVVDEYERIYPVYNPNSPKFDTAIVGETLTRTAYYQAVSGLGRAEALQHAVADMLLPESKRLSIQITSNPAGNCRFYGSGKRTIVSIDGQCPALNVATGLR